MWKYVKAAAMRGIEPYAMIVLTSVLRRVSVESDQTVRRRARRVPRSRMKKADFAVGRKRSEGKSPAREEVRG